MSGIELVAALKAEHPALQFLMLTDSFLYKEIAERLGIGKETVRTHVRHIYDKLHVRTRTEAVVKYLRT